LNAIIIKLRKKATVLPFEGSGQDWGKS